MKRAGASQQGSGFILMDNAVVDVYDEGAKALAVFTRTSIQQPALKDVHSLFSDLSFQISFVLIPEQERGLLVQRLTNDTTADLASFVSNGGTLIVAYAGGYSSLFSSVFGWTLTAQSCGGTTWLDETAASDTVFASGPSGLPALDAVMCVDLNSLPLGSKAVYRDGSAASVFLAPFGLGTVVGLAPDWYSSSSEWDLVLAAAVRVSHPGD